VGSVPASAPLSDLCGATIAADLKLDHDVACQGNGPSVGADGIKIDLNGHTISGSGIGNGIDVTSRTDVTISGGIIRNFFAGVRILNSTDIVLRQNVLQENTDGVDGRSGGIGNTIAHNEFRGNLSRGIMFRGNTSRNTLWDNTFTANRVGILVFGGVDNVIRSNMVSGSVLAGIRLNVFATGNVVRRNTIVSNPARVEFLITPTGWATGNTVVRNTFATNACGRKGPVEGNTVEKNRFDGNVADSCR
jgi:parallel beta-helix repeat protein